MNADGSDVTRLTVDPALDFDPVWSPEGDQIAFRSHRDDNEEVYMMNADGSNQHNLTGGDYSPAWSADGYLIFFRYDCFLVLNPKDLSLTQICKSSGAGTDSGHFSDWYQP